jgi:hypothetical protein
MSVNCSMHDKYNYIKYPGTYKLYETIYNIVNWDDKANFHT